MLWIFHWNCSLKCIDVKDTHYLQHQAERIYAKIKALEKAETYSTFQAFRDQWPQMLDKNIMLLVNSMLAFWLMSLTNNSCADWRCYCKWFFYDKHTHLLSVRALRLKSVMSCRRGSIGLAPSFTSFSSPLPPTYSSITPLFCKPEIKE